MTASAGREHQIRATTQADGPQTVTLWGPWLFDALDRSDIWWDEITQLVADERAERGTRWCGIAAMPGRARFVAHLIMQLQHLNADARAELHKVTQTGPAHRLIAQSALESACWAALRQALGED